MEIDLQGKLLRVLEQGKFYRIGGNREIEVNLRIIAITNKDLEKEVKNRRFRQDLYYRLKVFPIHILPLRERKGDIPLFVNYFVKEYSRKFRKPINKVSKEVLKIMENYDFPGNIRELKNIVERAVILCDGMEITREYLPDIFYNTKANN